MRFSKIISYELIGKSQSAEFLFCPICKTERTIEFRIERRYMMFLGVPIYPVSKPFDQCRCVVCRHPFDVNELRETQQMFDAQMMNQTIQIIAAFLHFFEFDSDSDVEKIVTQFEQRGEKIGGVEIQGAMANRIWGDQDILIWISRQSDLLDMNRRSQLIEVTATLSKSNESESEYTHRLKLFANAIGLGVEETDERIRHLAGQHFQ